VTFDLAPALRAGTRLLLLAGLTFAVGAPLSVAAEDSVASEAAVPADPQPAAAPAPDSPPVVTIAPTAGVWRDRLRDARRRVLDATADLDEVNAAYAGALFETPDDYQAIAAHQAKRSLAQKKLVEVRAAIPPMIDAARADGVSQRVLDLYEQATLE